ncbi:MAG: indole-3-glycerol phosphate synthase [Myxococcales bacterium]|nr:indole-3-glycerol phosphate synthase [Myxococcales bacterium]
MTAEGRLQPILEATVRRLEERRARKSESELLQGIPSGGSPRQAFVDGLRQPGLSVIAEFKRSSPSAGTIANRPLLPTVQSYIDGGAAACSILTNEDHFGGTLDDLRQASALGIPCLRKDFVVDPYMLVEARANGASAVLLITSILSQEQLQAYCDRAHGLELGVLVEVHDEEQLARATQVKPDAIGINARDLRDFSVSLDRTEQLLGCMPAGPIHIAESGIYTPADAQRMRAAGADAVLVGTSLMTSDDPALLLTQLRDGVEA